MTDSNDKKNYKTLYGLIELTQSIECKSIVLGCKEPISVAGISGHLLFPRLPDWTTESHKPLHKSLLPPLPAETWKYETWGQPTTYPTGESSVDRLLLEFVLPEAELKAAANAVHIALPSWRALFIDYFELVTKQQLYSDSVISPTHDHLNLFAWTAEGGKQRVHDSIEQEIVICTLEKDTALNSPMLKDVCRYSSQARQPALEYRLILEAYKGFSVGDYRKAIIEAATAAEIALVKGITSIPNENNLFDINELIQNKKYRTLGGRLKLAEKVNLVLPNINLDALLITPRNKVTHQADFVTAQIAMDAIEAVNELLTCISPSMSETN